MAKATTQTEYECYLVPDEVFEKAVQDLRDRFQAARASRPLAFGRVDAANVAGTMERRLSLQYDHRQAHRFELVRHSAFGELL